MPFPNLEEKHAGRPFVTARRLLDYRESLGNRQAMAPGAVVLTWQARLEGLVRERRDHKEVHGAGVGSVLLRLTPDLGLARLPIGAPVSDVLHGEQWEPHFGASGVTEGLWTLFETAEACLSA
jgi:hypothetical protein